MEKIKNLTKSILYYSKYYHLVRFWNELSHPQFRLVILTYHNISDGREYQNGVNHQFKLRPVLTFQMFDLHLKILKKSYEVVSLDEGVERLKNGKKQDNRLVAITFDDGYKSFYTWAYPLLQKYDFPATMFLSTGFIGENKIFWWDKLNQLFFHLETEVISPQLLSPIVGKNLAEGFALHRNNLKQKIWFLQLLENWLVGLGEEERDEKLEKLEALLLERKKVEFKPEPILNWEEIELMSKHKITFGCHTHSHLNLQHASLERVKEETDKSKREIELHLKTKVTSFAFPYGVDQESCQKVKPILQAHNFHCARTSLWGFNNQNSDLFLLKRAHIGLDIQESLARREMLLNFLMQNE
jgi:peptidoglycan/xylan/chitin deacetylase (PgdA/CDA1 family)